MFLLSCYKQLGSMFLFGCFRLGSMFLFSCYGLDNYVPVQLLRAGKLCSCSVATGWTIMFLFSCYRLDNYVPVQLLQAGLRIPSLLVPAETAALYIYDMR
jgi:hypothetical protein